MRIGLDAISVIITDCNIKNIENTKEKRNHNGALYLKVERQIRQDTYKITIILPSIIRDNNLYGFSIDDTKYLGKVIYILKRDLQEIVGINNLKKYTVKKIEINFNKKISNQVDINLIIKFLARVLLQTDAQQHLYCHGEKTIEGKTIKRRIVDGFKMDRHSSGRFYIKIYNKSQEMNLSQERSILRIEFQYTKRGIACALKKREISLFDILQKDAICQLIGIYKEDIIKYLQPPIRIFLQEATNTVYDDLKAGYGAYDAFVKRYDFVQYDYEIFCKGLRCFYHMSGKTKSSAIVQQSRVKKKILNNQLTVNTGTIKELQNIIKEIEQQ